MKKIKHKPGIAVHISNLRTRKLRQEDWEFEAILGYRALILTETLYYHYFLQVVFLSLVSALWTLGWEGRIHRTTFRTPSKSFLLKSW